MTHLEWRSDHWLLYLYHHRNFHAQSHSFLHRTRQCNRKHCHNVAMLSKDKIKLKYEIKSSTQLKVESRKKLFSRTNWFLLFRNREARNTRNPETEKQGNEVLDYLFRKYRNRKHPFRILFLKKRNNKRFFPWLVRNKKTSYYMNHLFLANIWLKVAMKLTEKNWFCFITPGFAWKRFLQGTLINPVDLKQVLRCQLIQGLKVFQVSSMCTARTFIGHYLSAAARLATF